MTTHDLKCWPEPFSALAAGVKTFEYRRNDRNFRAGDILKLRDWDPNTRPHHSGSVMEFEVTYIAYGPDFEIPKNYCVMSLTRVR